MPEFILDTAVGSQAAVPEFAKLDEFTQGYIQAAFFTETEPGTTRETWEPERHSSLPGDARYADLAPGTLASMIEDCAAFQKSQHDNFLALECQEIRRAAHAKGSSSHEVAGMDFWYTRNGHGCGFLDGDWPEPYATELDKAAKAFGEFSLYLGDDNKVYHT